MRSSSGHKKHQAADCLSIDSTAKWLTSSILFALKKINGCQHRFALDHMKRKVFFRYRLFGIKRGTFLIYSYLFQDQGRFLLLPDLFISNRLDSSSFTEAMTSIVEPAISMSSTYSTINDTVPLPRSM